MSFGLDYARAYDALYRTKNYPEEVHFVLTKLRQIVSDAPLRILDIGCGTGLHDVELASAGHTVKGVDMSTQMLECAKERRDTLTPCLQSRLSFQTGDARDFRTGSTFDAVVSLFHVMSYMAGDGEFDAALATARMHLRRGGAFLFDFWFGPAVVADPPQSRERTVEVGGKRIRRMTTPHWDRAKDVVRIVFDVDETDLVTGRTTHSTEEHVMRYFFENGMRKSLTDRGFETIEVREWLTGFPPTTASFGVYALAKAM